MEIVSTKSMIAVVIVLGIIIAFGLWWSGGLKNLPGGRAQAAAVGTSDLLTSVNFAVLASTYTNTVAGTVINGDLGYTTPPATAPVVNGTTHIADGAYNQAGTDQGSALSLINAEPCDFSFGSPTDLSLLSQPLAPGVYCVAAAASIGTGGITLSGAGTYIFRVSGALTTVVNSVVSLTGGASACDVFWTPTQATTLGADSTFVGTNIDDSGITVGSTVSWIGRALAFGGTVTTNTDTISVPSCTPPTTATLHVIKSVINTTTGTLTPADFMVHVMSATSSSDVAGSPQAGTSTPGTLYTLAPGTYNVSEDPNSSYAQTFGLDCVGGSVALAAGDDKICTIINTDIPPPPAAPSGGSGSPSPLIKIIKIPNPLSLPGGPGVVTYAYTVTNIGPISMGNVTVNDDKCSPATFLSGDANSDGRLDVNEAWIYSCTKTVSATETNTVTAFGGANGKSAFATASATVVVSPGFPNTGLVAPLINLTKVPSRLTPFPVGGGDVTYTYTVTNPGVVPMSDIILTDDKCAPMSGHSGDINSDNLLDPSEAWIYTCTTLVSASTRNVATVAGRANGLIALGTAFATVLVSTPGLPNTGFPPR